MEEVEVVMFVKSREELWGKLKEKIRKEHPYEIPGIIKFSVQAEKEYESWVHQETQPSGSHS